MAGDVHRRSRRCWHSQTIIGAHNSSRPQHGTLGSPWTWHRHTELLFDLLECGEIALAPLIGHCEPYTHAPPLYQMQLGNRTHAMGVILDLTGAP